MSIIIIAAEDSAVIVLPLDELEKFGLAVGDEIELSKNETDEIVLRLKSSERTQKVLSKTKKIIERRRSALLELGKGHE